MFQSLSIDRFRGLYKLRIEPLNRINLFLGKNNVGKTALLEAVFLLAGPTNPELPLRLNALRGFEQLRGEPEELWGCLFYKKDLTQSIWLKAELETLKTRQLTISAKARQEIASNKKDKKSLLVRNLSATSNATTRPSELHLVYSDDGKEKIRSRAFIKEDGIGLERGGRGYKFPDSVFVLARGSSSAENAERFSKLEEIGEEGELLPALRILEPRLKRLSVLVTGGVPMIHGDIGLGRMVPITLMGEGMGRLTTLLLAIVSSKGGIVLIDEIEAGFHYSVMPQVWTAMAEAARNADSQIFATTHSFDCLKAAHESFSQSSIHDLEFHRLDRVDEDIEATHTDREIVDTALTTGLELR